MSDDRQPGNGAIPTASRALAIASLLVLFLVLLLPAHPRDLVPGAFLRLPLELPLVVLAMLFTRGAASVALRSLVVAAAGLLLLLRLADLGSRLAFDRDFSPLVELHLIGDGWNLASATVGRLEAALAALTALIVFALLCSLLYRGLGKLSRLAGRPRRAAATLAALALTVGTGVLLAGRAVERELPVQADLAHDIVARVQAMKRSIDDQGAFVAELAADPLDGAPPPTFDALAGRDVVLLFIESYGRSALDGDGLREVVRPRLAGMERMIDAAGLHARSAWLESPIRGGRSWLAHATFASGLTISDQARFDRLLASGRKSVNRLFGEAGWRTAALMPAIRLDWPEGGWYGFDEIRDFDELGYAGEPFGWVTMPDQYTLSAFETLVRPPRDGRPVMAEIALISSHAPWTPLTEVLPWQDIGDGSVFDGSHRSGVPADELWNDRERLREHYIASIDYTLEVIGEYLVRHGRNALFVILGDHQPSAIINGWEATGEVPVHVVADDPALLERLPRALWSDGMLPAEDLPGQPMAAMRAMLAERFEAGTPGEPVDGAPADGASGEGSAPSEPARP